MVEQDEDRGQRLYNIRNTLGYSVQQVADMVGVGPRTVALWETGVQPMPDARWELFVLKLQRDLMRQPELVVVLDAAGQSVLDVVSDNNFFDLKELGDGTAIIRSIAIDRLTGQPRLHGQRFSCAGNEHVLRAAAAWRPALDVGVAQGDPAVLAMHRWLVRRVLDAEARNPKLRELKDAINEASRAVDQASKASEPVRKAKLRDLDAAIWALIEEVEASKGRG
ncbi:helix-turn-helix domain-containing protein [Ralstonia pseudosolanacearum]|uniref:helix-turn-helix domain-containing protein n=1 Tax=Ralstonia pseudosolanacearum TaxID=1310165 RepID=UPI003CEFF47D